ncbi:MAG: YegS/Rv2252/BmrU family lipid kinase [bacterium]|nr:YegS/Rv2252/BmrU family lipid kinase [bacterium]
MEENYLIICNPDAGKGNAAKVLSEYEHFLSKKNIPYNTYKKSYPSSLNPFSTLVIIGGDGTINHVINHFKDIQIPIAFIKGGTGNDYASLHLGKANLEEQYINSIQKNWQFVDAGTCNNRIFINGIGIGFDGWVVKRNIGKQFFTGIMAYYSTIISLLLFYKESETTITCNNLSWSQDLFMLSVAKGKTYGGGFKVAPNAHPSNSQFELIAIGEISLLNRFRYLPVIEKGKHLNLNFVKHQQGQNIQVSASHTLQAHLDGEWMEASQFNINLLPSKYRIKSMLYH